MLRFSDGMTFDTSGPPRITSRSDGLYVVGNGMMQAVNSEEEGRAVVAKMQRNGKDPDPENLETRHQ